LNVAADSKQPRPLAWVTGAAGLIGSYLVKQASEHAAAWRVRPLTRAELDLTDFAKVRALFETEKPWLIIHCAALSRSPACQANPEFAYKLNVDVTSLLAELALNVPLMFFSSDLVFDGNKGNYDESDEPNPSSVYGETKLRAEQVVLQNPRHIVLRTSLNGGTSPTGDRGFNEEMRHAWEQGKTLRLFTDEFRCPTAACVTAHAVWELAASGAAGLFHLAGAERLSRWEIGELIAARWPQLRPKIEPASLREYQGAPRPPDTSLNCAKVQRMLSFMLPGLGEWLKNNPQEVF
jgi:dTDP-4-dehydrorhamnose reductase